MRVAYFSPLPPARSGIADYSAELLPHLASRMEIECFTDRAAAASQASTSGLPIRSVAAFAGREDQFDLALYQLGNNADYHGSIYEQLQRFPGVVVLHEYMLHHLVQGLTLARGQAAGYVEAMRYAYGSSGERLARRLVDTGLPVDAWRYPLFERVVDRSLGILVHNETTRRRVLEGRPDALIELVPHHLALDRLPAGDGGEVRQRFGVAADDLLVASFGFVTPYKRLEVSLRAFAELRRSRPDSRYLLAGEVSPHYDLAPLFEQGLGDGVVVTGRLELPDLLAAMNACDIAVNLRYPTGGETSGTLMRLLGLGKAVVVSNHGSFAEVPDGCCAKVDLDDREGAVLLAYLRHLAEHPETRRQMGENARRQMLAAHTLEGSARRYAEFLERVASADRQPFPEAPPLTAESRSPYADWLAGVGSAIADLGVADHDLPMLRQVAAVVDDLGLSPEGHEESIH